tara:strand:- start:44609 stop:45034 length:426 start_codon:yes stop_codon:yes gene_type:complete
MEKDYQGFSEETRDWLGGWLSGGEEITSLPKIVLRECQDFMPQTDEQVILYHAVQKNDNFDQENAYFKYDLPSSWTHDLEQARNFKIQTLPIISVKVGESNILIDTVELPRNYVRLTLGGWPDEREVILLEGVYRVKVVEV